MNLLNSLLGSSVLQLEWGILFGGLCLALIAVWFIIWILVAIWVYRDAESRGMSGALWLIIVILIGLIGIIIYLVVRSDKTQMQPGYAPYPQQQYPQQQYPQYPQQQYPQQAYQPPPSVAKTCPKCGAPVQPGMQYCQSCGSRL